MENNNSIRTDFKTPLEIENYMSILGGKMIGKDKFRLDNFTFSVDREYQGIYCHRDLPRKIVKLLEERGMSDSIYGRIIFHLEALVLIHTYLNGEDIDEHYEDNLYQARKEMLNRVLEKINPIEFKGLFSEFDQAITPFFRDDFDPEKFLEECVFNTTGYYEKEGYDKCLKFQWYTLSNPEKIYDIEISKNGFWDTIWNKYKDRTDEQVYHFVPNDRGEVVKCFHGYTKSIVYDADKQTIERSDLRTTEERKATGRNIQRVIEKANSYIDSTVSFEKGISKGKNPQVSL